MGHGQINELIKSELLDMGASLVGFADLSDLAEEQTKGYKYGIAIAAAIRPQVINNIALGPTKEYYDEYNRLNNLLDSLDKRAAEIIRDSGFTALPKTRSNVIIDYNDHSTVLPHKTVATRAGLGWIGKCALLVTEQFGSALRISSVLTDAPLETAQPVTESRCGNCDSCVRNCPAEALSGDLWHSDKKRGEFYDFMACRNKALERTWRIAPGETHCGLCILVCPRTKKYIEASGCKHSFPGVDMASRGDFEQILQLQRLAYQSEAGIYDDFSLPPLLQTLEELEEEARHCVILKVVEDRKIVGSVRAFEKAGTCYIGKLVVHPQYQNRNRGKALLAAVEKCFEHVRYELFTGFKSEKNLYFYQKQGYRAFKTQKINDRLELIYMEKNSF